MNRILLILCLSCSLQLSAQEFIDMRFEDFTYLTNVRSVKFHVSGFPLSYPIIELNSGTPLDISFDDLDGDVRNYYYTVRHFDRNWKPSQLNPMEYLTGFQEEVINDYEFSFKTLQGYTTYRASIPNNSVGWSRSGNYLLIIYEKEGNQYYPVITRRFVVVDPQVQIDAQFVRPSQAGKFRTHHEIDFSVNHDKFDIRSPRQEVTAVVLQNGRWETALDSIPPLFLRNNLMLFDYQDKVVFPAGKEFRYLDIRSLRYRSENVSLVERLNDRFEVTLYKDKKRMNEPYLEFEDVNGDFLIETQDQNNQMAADYANVLFSLYSPNPYYDHNVYIMGEFTDWQPLREYQMAYNEQVNAYVIKLPLKQGFYNYAYGVFPKDQDPDKLQADFEETEGNAFETQNNYTILIYYRPFGGRADQVIGLLHTRSN